MSAHPLMRDDGGNVSSITAGTVTVRTLFEQRKVVPAYQRDYAWQPMQEIGALLDDLFDHFGLPPDARFGEGTEDDYLLGPVVLTDEAIPQIIDGQQRVLTLFMLLAALRARLVELGAQDTAGVEALRHALVDFDDAADDIVPRIRHHDAIANEALLMIARHDLSGPKPAGKNSSLSHRRIIHGFNHIVKRVREELPQDADKVWEFARFLRGNVKLIQIATDDVGQALIVFERANARGRPLDPSDLLKNLIFQNADADDFEKLSQVWRELQATVEEMKQVQIIDYLRWYHLAMPGGFYATKRDFYSKIRKYVDAHGLAAPAYIADLRDRAALLRGMATENRNPSSGARSAALAGIRKLGGPRQKQHWPLLLSVANWDAAHFEVVARGLERLLLFAYVTDHRSQTLEREIRDLSEFARELTPSDENLLLLAARLDSVAGAIREEGLYAERFSRLTYDGARSAVGFILFKIHDALYRVYDNKTLMGADAASSTYEGAEIEHIWPQADAEALATEDDDDIVHRIGNLTLLGKAMNASGGKRKAEEKLSHLYTDADERFLVARNLHERMGKEKMGEATGPNRAIALTPTGYATWGPEEISRLSTEYRTLLDQIMPPLTQDVDGVLHLTPVT